MLIEVHKEKLKELTARIIKEKEDGTYEHQGSGLLYIDDKDDAYILTAAHVLNAFTQQDDTVVVECYSKEKRPEGVKVVEDYLFRVKRADVWSDYEGVVPEDGKFKANDVAVIPLSKDENPKRKWLDKRARAGFLDENVSLERCGVMGFGYPKYTEERRVESACDPIGTNIIYVVHNDDEHSVDWKLDSKLSKNARHGLSGSVIALSEAQNVVLAAIVQDTYPNNDGNRIVGTDLHKIQELLSKKGVWIRQAYHDQERQTGIQLWKINENLKALEKNNTERGTLNQELEPDVINLMKDVLNEVLGLNLEEKKKESRTYCVDTKAGCAVRIVPSVSGNNKIETIRNAFVNDRLHIEYPRLMVLTLQGEVSVSQISRKSGFTIQKDDVWDATRLLREIWNLDREKVARISQYLDIKKPVISQVGRQPVHQLPRVLDNKDYFEHKSRKRELEKLKELVNDPQNKRVIFISGVGGIGKTDLAIRLAMNCYPDKPVFLLKYAAPTPEEAETGMEGMKSTILKAHFSKHTKGNLSMEEEYEKKMGYIQAEYDKAVLIVDDFYRPGKTLGELCSEESCRELIASGAYIIFTTRCSLEEQAGITVGAIKKKPLLALTRKYCPERYGSNKSLTRMIKLVNGHTLTVELMAKTMEKSWGKVGVKKFEKMIREGTEEVNRFPNVYRKGAKEPCKLHEHLRSLFDVDSLTPEEKRIMCCAMLVHKKGMDGAAFLDILESIDVDVMDRMNRLVELGWLIKVTKLNFIRMDPMIAIVCRRVLKFDPVLCEKFLDGIWEYRKTLRTNHVDRYFLAECFDQAALWGRESHKTEEWKEKAEQIRSEYTGRKQEVGV